MMTPELCWIHPFPGATELRCSPAHHCPCDHVFAPGGPMASISSMKKRCRVLFPWPAWKGPGRGSSDSDKHLHKVRSRQRKERHLWLRLRRPLPAMSSGSRGAYEANTPFGIFPQAGVLEGFFKKITTSFTPVWLFQTCNSHKLMSHWWFYRKAGLGSCDIEYLATAPPALRLIIRMITSHTMTRMAIGTTQPRISVVQLRRTSFSM